MNSSNSSVGHGRRGDVAKEAFWRETLRRFAAAGQSVRAFCAARALSEPAFYAWRRRLAQRDTAATKASSLAQATPVFLPVRLDSAASGRMEIVLPQGTRIRLRGPVDRAALAEVVAALHALG